MFPTGLKYIYNLGLKGMDRLKYSRLFECYLRTFASNVVYASMLFINCSLANKQS